MFDTVQLTPECRSSVLEEGLRGWLDRHSPAPSFVVDFPPHGGRAAALEAVEPRARAFAGLLEAGAAHLGRARAAHLARCRAARPAVLTPVSEWAVDEVMIAFGLSSAAAAALLAESITLVQRLPATLDALEAGALSWGHARRLAEVLAPLADEGVGAEVEERLLAARAAGRSPS